MAPLLVEARGEVAARGEYELRVRLKGGVREVILAAVGELTDGAAIAEVEAVRPAVAFEREVGRDHDRRCADLVGRRAQQVVVVADREVDPGIRGERPHRYAARAARGQARVLARPPRLWHLLRQGVSRNGQHRDQQSEVCQKSDSGRHVFLFAADTGARAVRNTLNLQFYFYFYIVTE
jgi:hypothetical protein